MAQSAASISLSIADDERAREHQPLLQQSQSSATATHSPEDSHSTDPLPSTTPLKLQSTASIALLREQQRKRALSASQHTATLIDSASSASCRTLLRSRLLVSVCLGICACLAAALLATALNLTQSSTRNILLELPFGTAFRSTTTSSTSTGTGSTSANRRNKVYRPKTAARIAELKRIRKQRIEAGYIPPPPQSSSHSHADDDDELYSASKAASVSESQQQQEQCEPEYADTLKDVQNLTVAQLFDAEIELESKYDVASVLRRNALHHRLNTLLDDTADTVPETVLDNTVVDNDSNNDDDVLIPLLKPQPHTTLDELQRTVPQNERFTYTDECRALCHWRYSEHITVNSSAAHLRALQYGPAWMAFRVDEHDVSAVGQFLSGSTFRMFADWVGAGANISPAQMQSASGESHNLPEVQRVAACLPPGAVLYIKRDWLGGFINNMLPHLKRPFVLLTGLSDYEAIHNSMNDCAGDCKSILGNPLLIHWFAENVDMSHPKLSPLPIGLNLAEQGQSMLDHLREQWKTDEAKLPVAQRAIVQPVDYNYRAEQLAFDSNATSLPTHHNPQALFHECALHRYLRLQRYSASFCVRQRNAAAAVSQGLTPDVERHAERHKLQPGLTTAPASLVNFSPHTHSSRGPTRALLCDHPEYNVSCIANQGLASLPQMYRRLASDPANALRYVYSPRGNGLDCIRTWETLFLGRVPIVDREQASISEMFTSGDLAVSTVQSMQDAKHFQTVANNDYRFYPSMSDLSVQSVHSQFPRHSLTRAYWRAKIQHAIQLYYWRMKKWTYAQYIFSLGTERRRCVGKAEDVIV